MKVEKIEVNILKSGHITNSYVIYNEETKEALVIDPGDEFEKLKEYIDENNLNVNYIVITHAHFDHVLALEKLQKYTSSQVLISKEDLEMLKGNVSNASKAINIKQEPILIDEKNIKIVEDGMILNMLDDNFSFYKTPGHTSGCIIMYNKSNNFAVTGDTLFADCYGRCDLETGSFSQMVESLRKIFSIFDDDMVIYPGHGESSTINRTRRYISLLLRLKNEKL